MAITSRMPPQCLNCERQGGSRPIPPTLATEELNSSGMALTVGRRNGELPAETPAASAVPLATLRP